jgi:HAD superfamily hydrolase (TIGR01450 family)
MTRSATIRELLDGHDGVLLDAFGVLIDGSGALPGAAGLLAELGRRGTPYAIVSNDASRSRETFSRRFASFGLEVPPERFVTSGTLLPAYFRDRGLAGARTCVLGTEDSCAFVREGGGVPVDVPIEGGLEVDAVAICDDGGTPFLEGMEVALSAIVRAVRAGRRPALVVPNPDLVYPKGRGELGFTAGAMAVLIETALERVLPGSALVFDRLGKPYPHLMLAAATRLGVAPDRLVMIGDQLETDVAGAHAAGIASALLRGISHWDARSVIAPTYLLGTIEP